MIRKYAPPGWFFFLFSPYEVTSNDFWGAILLHNEVNLVWNLRRGKLEEGKPLTVWNLLQLYQQIWLIIQCSPRINIKCGGVHQWYMTFGQQCSIGVIKQCFSALTIKLKGGGAPWYHPLGETLNNCIRYMRCY